MSAIYKNLTDEDLKIEDDALKTLEKQLAPKSRGLGKSFKSIIIIGFILSLTSVAGSGYLYKAINKEKRNREALESVQNQIREKAGVLELDTAKSKTEISKLRQQLQGYASQRSDFEKKLEQSRREILQLRAKLKELEAKSEAIEKAASKFQAEAGLAATAPAVPSVSSAAPVAAQPAQDAVSAPAPAPAKVFQVLTVNRKFNFVVINMGLKDNVKMGDVLHLQRDGKTIGQASIEKIYDNFSAATLVQETKENPIIEGDKVSKA